MENKNWLKKLIKGKKKAFTLIELLAIIVILAIIAVITVPIILNIIENAKKGAATNSAYGYKDAIEKFYASKLSLDSTYNIPDGLHTKADFDTMGVLINGKAPASNSFLKTYKNVVTQGCLQFDEYKVEFVDGKPTNTTKGECKTVNIVYTDEDESGTINLGDTVKIENEEFYIIDIPKDGHVKLLSKYNLDANSRQVSSNYVVNNFSDTYIENYTNYLRDSGAYFIVEGRKMKYTEAVATGCNSACPDFVVNQPYRLENDSGQSGTRSITAQWREITSSNYDGTGMRALIVIYESAIVDQYTITFDSRGGTEVASRTIIPGNKVGTLPEPTKSNSELEGWYTDTSYTTKINTDTIPPGSATYYARWIMTKVTSFTDVDGSGTITLGDNVKIYDDDFYVIAEPSDNKVKLLSKYNLSSNSRQVSSNYVVNNFSDTYIENYTNYLLGQGAGYIVEGRKMKYTEAVATGCNSACPDFVVNQPYRLENDSGQSGTRSITAYWREITSSNYDGTGMRALIVIDESAITIPTN